MQRPEVNISGASSQSYTYRLGTIASGQREGVEEVVKKFIGEPTTVQESATGEYIFSSQHLEKWQLQKLQVLCRLSAKLKLARPIKKDLEDSSKPKGKAPVTAPPAPPAPQSKDRPDTLRIKNIPKSYSKGEVHLQIQMTFKPRGTVKIHSLAASNADFGCATATFPDEDYDFPTLQLERIKQDRNGLADDKFEYDTEFKGLTPLYDAGQNANVDIVAVVGLGTHPFGTFRSPEPHSTDMWLRDYLPEDIKDIRVVLYGYPSKVDSSKSIEKIEDIAKTLLNRLTNFRRATSTRKRPIIFLGQSLGGLIVQECLVLSSSPNIQLSDPEATLIFQSWCGLVGFGIPIAGLNNPALLAVVRDQPNKTLMQELCLNSDGEPSSYLKDLRARFEECRQRRSPIQAQTEIRTPTQTQLPLILYFWEKLCSLPRTRAGISNESVLMVPEDSSTPGAENLGLHSDHSGMVKYKGKADELYEDVKDNIDKMIRRILESHPSPPQPQPQPIHTSPKPRQGPGTGKGHGHVHGHRANKRKNKRRAEDSCDEDHDYQKTS